MLRLSKTASAPTKHNYLYIADTAHLPYGNKSPEYLIERGRALSRFFLSQGITTIIVACHTSSATSLAVLQKEFPEISYIDLIPYTVTQALTCSSNKRIGVLATQATVQSGIHKRLLQKEDPHITVISQACPLFVTLIESEASNADIQKAIALYMQPLFEANVDTAILGCTHYEFLRPLIEAYAPSVQFISAAQATILKSAQVEEFSIVATGSFTHSPTFIKNLIGPIQYTLEVEKNI